MMTPVYPFMSLMWDIWYALLHGWVVIWPHVHGHFLEPIAYKANHEPYPW